MLTLAVALAALYLYNLNGVGVLQTDEPRYLAIGQAMTRSGDWITPMLWGHPWFEKPALLYWMTGVGAEIGLGPELAGRLPVAVLSLAFLLVGYCLFVREFGRPAAGATIALLASSAGWLAYSELALTDLPLAVFFSLAVFLALPLVHEGGRNTQVNARFLLIGVCFGLALLAKGLVPIVLAVPFCWFLRRHWKRWWLACLAAAIIALPWYVAVTERSGYPFIQEFFLKHHLQRLYSASLQHVQPWFYYFPVLLAALFPWTPLFVLLLRRNMVWDARRRFLASIVVFGFAFFSVTLNKLPGYLLPLLPSAFAVLGSQLENRRLVEIPRWWLLPSACLIALVPLLVSVVPGSLARGKFSFAAIHLNRTEAFYVLLPIAALVLARRSWAGLMMVLCLATAGLYLKVESYPVLDRLASPRQLWNEIESKSSGLCDTGTNREWLYGLEFYRGSEVPPCAPKQGFRYEIHSSDHQRPVVGPFAQ